MGEGGGSAWNIWHHLLRRTRFIGRKGNKTMSEESKIVEKVVFKLTELRMQCGPQERYVLDKIITGESPEVVAHAFTIDTEHRVELDGDRYKVQF
jgi:hypothetical protein